MSHTISLRRKLARALLTILATLAGLWLAGLCLFVVTIERYAEPSITPDLPRVDGIVVLTGGSDRLDTGLELLTSGNAHDLLVSGVPSGITLDNRLDKAPVPRALRDCCITLGHAAADTVGNAPEAKSWAEDRGFRSLRVVTAHYHMPRSLLTFRAVMPEVTILPHPVKPESVRLEGWWLRPGTATLLATEYSKFLLALIMDHVRPFF